MSDDERATVEAWIRERDELRARCPHGNASEGRMWYCVLCPDIEIHVPYGRPEDRTEKPGFVRRVLAWILKKG